MCHISLNGSSWPSTKSIYIQTLCTHIMNRSIHPKQKTEYLHKHASIHLYTNRTGCNLGIAICCAKQVGLECTFEGGDRIWGTDLEGEGIPHCGSRVWKWFVAKGHSSDWRDRESGFVRRRSQGPSRCIEWEKIGKIQRGVESESVVSDSGDLVMNPCIDWEPMKGCEMMGNVVGLWQFQYEAGGIVLHSLKLISQRLRAAREKRIAVIKTWKNKGRNNGDCGVCWKKAYGTDAA